MDLLHLDLCKVDYKHYSWYVQSYPNTMLFCMQDLTIWHLFLVNWCWLDFMHQFLIQFFWFWISVFSQWVVDFLNFINEFSSLCGSMHAFSFSFFLFLPFHARCRTLSFLDDLTLMQFCIIFAFFSKQISRLFYESNTVAIRRQFPYEFLYISISQSSALDVSAKLLLVKRVGLFPFSASLICLNFPQTMFWTS